MNGVAYVFTLLVFLGALAAIIIFSVLLSKPAAAATAASAPAHAQAPAMTQAGLPQLQPSHMMTQQWLVGKHWLIHQNDLEKAFSRDQSVYFWAKSDAKSPYVLRMSINRHPEDASLGPNADLYTSKLVKEGAFVIDGVVGLKSKNVKHPLKPGIKRSSVASLKSLDGEWIMTENEEGDLVVTRGGKLHLLLAKSRTPELGVLPKDGAVMSKIHNKRVFGIAPGFHSAQDDDPRKVEFAGFLESKSGGLHINRRLFLGNNGGFYAFSGATSTSLSGRKTTEVVKDTVYRSLLTDVFKADW